jgi:hypothetical protein
MAYSFNPQAKTRGTLRLIVTNFSLKQAKTEVSVQKTVAFLPCRGALSAYKLPTPFFFTFWG